MEYSVEIAHVDNIKHASPFTQHGIDFCVLMFSLQIYIYIYNLLLCAQSIASQA